MHGDPLMTLHQSYKHKVGQRSFEVTEVKSSKKLQKNHKKSSKGASIIVLVHLHLEKYTEQFQVTFDPKGQILRVTSGSNSKLYSKKIKKIQGKTLKLF